MLELLGSAIVGLLSLTGLAIGWIVTHRQTISLDVARREERITDIQVALLAEIRSRQYRLTLFDPEQAQEVEQRIRESAAGRGTFTPFITREAEPFVFDSIVGEINLLPNEVIDPVVLYYRQVAALALFAEDLRSERYEKLDADRKAEMYRDYIAMGALAFDLAETAIAAIDRSLHPTVNKTA